MLVFLELHVRLPRAMLCWTRSVATRKGRTRYMLQQDRYAATIHTMFALQQLYQIFSARFTYVCLQPLSRIWLHHDACACIHKNMHVAIRRMHVARRRMYTLEHTMETSAAHRDYHHPLPCCVLWIRVLGIRHLRSLWHLSVPSTAPASHLYIAAVYMCESILWPV